MLWTLCSCGQRLHPVLKRDRSWVFTRSCDTRSWWLCRSCSPQLLSLCFPQELRVGLAMLCSTVAELRRLQRTSCPHPVDQRSEEKYEGAVELSFRCIHGRSCQWQLPDCSDNIKGERELKLSYPRCCIVACLGMARFRIPGNCLMLHQNDGACSAE